VRNIFLILLLANLLLLGWTLWVDPEPQVAMQTAGADELAVYGQSNSRASMGPGSADPSSQCVYIGPVPDAGAAQKLAATLADRGIEIKGKPVIREGREWLGHWVQVQGFIDKEQAEATRQRLLVAGLLDAYLMPDGLVTIISLGVFREEGRARSVIEAARRAGVKAVMNERERVVPEYWLVSGPTSGQQSVLRDLATGPDRILRAESLPCPVLADRVPKAVAPE